MRVLGVDVFYSVMSFCMILEYGLACGFVNITVVGHSRTICVA